MQLRTLMVSIAVVLAICLGVFVVGRFTSRRPQSAGVRETKKQPKKAAPKPSRRKPAKKRTHVPDGDF